MTRNRFFPVDFLVVVCLFNGTKSCFSVENYIGTFLPVNQWRFIALIFADNPFALSLNAFNALGSQIRFYFVVNIVQNLGFFLVERGTGITVNAALTMACREVAHKFFLKNFI